MYKSSSIVGTIPENLTYIYSDKPSTIHDYVDGKYVPVITDVYPAYISDSDNEKTLETGRKWADKSYWDAGEKKKRGKVVEETVPNNPITDVRLYDLEKRSEGGRAYKVLVHGKFYVDFREDILLDCIQHGKITGKGEYGVLEGEFIFARVGAEMKLVRVGSDLHNKLIQSTIEKKAPKLKELEIGAIYHNRRGNQEIYLGKYIIASFDLVCLEHTMNDRYSYRAKFGPSKIKIENIKFKELMGFISYYGDTKGLNVENDYRNIYFRKTHSFSGKSDVKPYSLATVEKELSFQFDKWRQDAIKTLNNNRDPNNRYHWLPCVSYWNNKNNFETTVNNLDVHSGYTYAAIGRSRDKMFIMNELSAEIINWDHFVRVVNNG